MLGVLIFFVLGACVGSFAGVILTSQDDSWLSRRSRCESCSHILSWEELVPIFSFIKQRGKCQKCRRPIPFFLLSAELIGGSVWGVVSFFLMRDLSFIQIFLVLCIFSGVLLIVIDDFRTHSIDDKVILPVIFLVIGIIFWGYIPWFPTAISATIGACIGYALYMIQMIIPQMMLRHTLRDRLGDLSTIFLWPLWAIVSFCGFASYAHRLFPTVASLEQSSHWVGPGDIRLGILFGLLTGPLGFLWAMTIGYSAGLVWYGILRLFREDIRVLPVAPLLMIGYIIMFFL